MYKIRNAVAGDVQTILRIAATAGLSRWSAGGYQMEIERTDSMFLVVSAASTDVQGFIVGRVVPGSDEDSLVAELYNIGVNNEYRRLGIGSRLLRQFIESARSKGAQKVFLEVRSGNDSAIKFYEKHGFTQQFVRKSFYADPLDDATVMGANI